MKAQEGNITGLDMRIAVSVLICCLTSVLLDHFGWKFTYGEMKLEIIQKMTACISCLLCCQDTVPVSRTSGINRLIITAIGGTVGILVILLDILLANKCMMVLLIAAGILLTLFLCKKAKVPYINARIGGVTFILVTCTLAGSARIWYGVFRFVSTLYSVLVVLLVTWIWERRKMVKNGTKDK